jgi:hypothetical protein
MFFLKCCKVKESHVKTFAENQVKEDTSMDIIIPSQDAVSSPPPPPKKKKHHGNQPLVKAYATSSWKRTKIFLSKLEGSLKHKHKAKLSLDIPQRHRGGGGIAPLILNLNTTLC